MHSSDTICAACHGRGLIYSHLHFSDGSTAWRDLRCFRCDGTGVVSAAQHAAYALGRARRELRIAARLSQQDMATRLGCIPQEYSQMEQGFLGWPTDSDAVFQALQEEEKRENTL